MGGELDGGDAGTKHILVLQQADPHLIGDTNDVVVRPVLSGVLAGMVPHPSRPIFFLGVENRIVNYDDVVVTFSHRELPVVRRYGHIDAPVVRVLEDGARWVASVCPLVRDL